MKLTKWSPLLNVGVEYSVILIWVSIPNLRSHLFSPRILHALGFIFGQPLKAIIVRVIVELDITKNFPDKIWLGPENSGYIQRVQLEEFPAFCESGKRLGHFRGESSSSSAPLSVLHSHVNPILPVVNAKSNAIAVSSLFVNEERIVEGSNDLPFSNNVDVLIPIIFYLPIVSVLSVSDVIVNHPCSEVESEAVSMCNDVKLDSILALVDPMDVEAQAVVLGDGPMALAAVVDGLDPPATALEGVSVPVGCLNLNVPVSVGEDVGLLALGVDASNGQGIDIGSKQHSSPIQSKAPLVDVPISIISNVDLFAHLAKSSVVWQCDWLEDDNSSAGGEEINKLNLDARDNFDYSLLQIVDAGLFKNNVKLSKRKSKNK
ncbi:hypothetical protein IEQ34_004740 [Dendrobium chrysotoxum]|uniref:DUF4283 domain-containing protein n=1 Tax=Dendrobium chrysotoxum TaxID=161865 RepID=A0AAV7HF37_DENCH|nr:hypothetical protein IEQ34_004740 [Dendrobium chrysotoxum]